MAEFLSTDGIISKLEIVVNNAKTRLVLISPLVKLTNTMLKCIKDADKRFVETRLVVTKDKMNQDTIDKLKQFSNLSMYYSQNLQVNCYFSETDMIITSLSLNNILKPRNVEMGVMVNNKSDSDIYNAALKEIEKIFKKAEKIRIDEVQTDKSANFKKNIDSINRAAFAAGFCIRCKKRIFFDTSTPYCMNCYNEWSEWDFNADYKEKYCHSCGIKWVTSLVSPLCNACGAPTDVTSGKP